MQAERLGQWDVTNSNSRQQAQLPRGLCFSLGGKYVTYVSGWGISMSNSTKLKVGGTPREWQSHQEIKEMVS